ncbi:MAG TPA: acetate--CoA ligase [Acidimicrobiales bacterium]
MTTRDLGTRGDPGGPDRDHPPSTDGAGTFWDLARRDLDGLPGGGLNIAHEAVDRHVRHGRGDRVAIRSIDRRGRPGRSLTYAELAAEVARFANVLADLEIGRGDHVVGLLPRIPEVHVATLGTLKLGAVWCPLFAAFGPDPLRRRLVLGRARALVTTASLYRRRLAGWVHDVPGLDHVLVLTDEDRGGGGEGDGRGEDGEDGDHDEPLPDRTVDLRRAMAAASPARPTAPTRPDDPALLFFTSGTTGTPKGAIHVHEAVVHLHASATRALDLLHDDVFWCTADPGWVTGTAYGVIAPLTHGVTCLVDEGELDAARWYRQLAEHHVSVWYTSPTALRLLARAGADLPHQHDLHRLRLVASVGEPLDAEIVLWTHRAWGVLVHDGWWQTETGGIMIANQPGTPVHPGSMGRPLPGVEATVLRRDTEDRLVHDADGHPVPCAPDEVGELALRAGWPSMFRGYLGRPDLTARCFADGWYLTGDLVRRDADGWYWFVGRRDDVITTAGHLVGPFEIERVLLEHPAVVEAGVVGLPDPVMGEQVKAFVVLAPEATGDAALRRELRALCRTRLGPALAPRAIEVRDELPHTRSGKILRRLLRARELGLPEGDLSTLAIGAAPVTTTGPDRAGRTRGPT